MQLLAGLIPPAPFIIVVGHEGVCGVLGFSERERERDVAKEGKKNLLSLPAECLQKEDAKQCHQNGTILKFCFLSNSK